MDTILIIGGRLEAIQQAKRLGLRVVLLQHKERLLAGQAEAADALLLVDYLDWDVVRPIVRAAHEAYGFTAVVTLVEQATELAGRIRDLLGLGGTPYEVAHRFHDKLAMRTRLRETGLEDVACAAVDNAAQLHEFGARHGYPVVVKPVDGTSSRGVALVCSPFQVDQVWQDSAALRDRDDLPMAGFYPVGCYLAEEYIDGAEYSVETFSFHGNHIVIAITDKLSHGFLEMGHAQPAILDERDEHAIAEHVAGFLTAMGLRDGVAHTEVALSAAGPRIIESHDRVAGGRIMDLVNEVYGIDLERYAVGAPFGRVPELTGRPTPVRAAATRFVIAEPGTVVAIEGVDEVRDYPGVLGVEVYVRVGDQVVPIDDNFCRHVQVVVTADNTAAAIELCDALVDKVRVITRASERTGP